VLAHLAAHAQALAALPSQPWVAATGPGLVRAVRALHDRYRASPTSVARLPSPAAAAHAAPAAATGSASLEATLKVLRQEGPAAGGAAGVAAARAELPQRGAAVRVTVLADGSVSMPYNAASDGGAGSAGRRRTTRDGGAADDTGSDQDEDASARAAARDVAGGADQAALPRAIGRRRLGDRTSSGATVSLPMPPLAAAHSATTASTAHPLSILAPSLAERQSGAAGSAFATPGAALHLTPPPPAAGLGASLRGPLTHMGSTPSAAVWGAEAPPRDYAELLGRLCPNAVAVAAALAEEDAPEPGAGGAPPAAADRAVARRNAFLHQVGWEQGRQGGGSRLWGL
jgi:1,3-beta-glucan synthase